MTIICHYYDAERQVKILENQDVAYNLNGETTFFRKFCEEENERVICRLLKDNPHRNCVTIYDVRFHSIDMEFLDTNVPLKHSHLADIQSALIHLHSLGVVYIDLKTDNIGYSHIDRCYKIFDFDMSGVTRDEKTWSYKPNRGYILHDVMKILKNRDKFTLLNIDDEAYQRYLEKEWKHSCLA